MSGLRQLGGRGGNMYHRFEAGTEGNNLRSHDLTSSPEATDALSPDSVQTEVHSQSPWGWSVRSQPRSSPVSEWYRLQIQDPDRLFLSVSMDTPSITPDDDLQRKHTRLPPPLPQWIWTILVTTLGIGSGSSPKHYCISTILRVLTTAAALLFGFCGLFFNVYDMISEYTKTTVLMCIAKSVLGLYWIGLGIYANSLAARLFNNKRMVDCIRLHSKTFLKISTAFIIIALSIGAVATNLYSNTYLLQVAMTPNATKVNEANCASAGVNVLLCQLYFGSKIVYSAFCLLWNLLVVGIFLSVCRTHTISIRRFMKELMYDTKIYEEFCRIRLLKEHMHQNQQLPPGDDRRPNQTVNSFPTMTDSNIWDDDIADDHESDAGAGAPSNASLLQSLRSMRQSTSNWLASDIASSLQAQEMHFPNTVHAGEEPGLDSAAWSMSDGPETRETTPPAPNSQELQHLPKSTSQGDLEDDNIFTSEPDSNEENRPQDCPPGNGCVREGRRAFSRSSTFLEGQAPIMKNEDLMFTYFQLLRRLSSTSRLLQRWISSWITFILLWGALLIVYWTNHAAQLSGVIQFLIPLVALGLLTSAYAEVNFEGERLLKCVLPTEERMPVIYYFQNTKMEVKIFSFTMTYNTIVTVVAGVAVTFATRIILDQIDQKGASGV